MSIKTLSSDFAFYGLLDLLQKSVSIIMVPVYTRVLTQKQYGDLDIIIIFASVLFVLVDLQFTSGFTRLYYEQSEKGQERRFVGTALAGRLVGGIAVTALFIVLGFLGLVEFGFMPSFKGNSWEWILAVGIIPLTLSYDILLLHARMLRWKRVFAMGSFSCVFLSCLLSAFFAVVLKWGALSVLLGMFAGRAMGTLILYWGLREKFEFCLDREPFRELIRYTWPLIPGFWLSFSSVYVNRFFVFAELGAEENAILSVCMKIAGVIGMFAVAFQSAWQPLAMSHIGSTEGNAFYVRSSRLFIAGSIFSMFVIAAFLDPILSILAPGSYGAVKYYFPLFAVGMVVSTCATNIQLRHQIAKTTHWISINSFITIAINVGILYFFTKSNGIFAAGFAWVISFVTGYLVMYFTAQMKHRIPYDKKAFSLLAAGCILLLGLGFASYRGVIPGWLFSLLTLAGGVVIPWLVIRESELEALLAHLRQRRDR